MTRVFLLLLYFRKEEVILERVKNARRELLRKNDFDHVVLNDDVERAYKELKALVERIIA